MRTTRRSATEILGGASLEEEYLHYAIKPYSVVKKMHDDLTHSGIDECASGLMTLLIYGVVKPIGASEAYHDTQNPYSDWSAQDPDKWIVALNSCIR